MSELTRYSFLCAFDDLFAQESPVGEYVEYAKAIAIIKELESKLSIQRTNLNAVIKQTFALETIIANNESSMFLISVLADIRIATGVNEKPMLSELAGAIKAKFDELEASNLATKKALDFAEGCRTEWHEMVMRFKAKNAELLKDKERLDLLSEFLKKLLSIDFTCFRDFQVRRHHMSGYDVIASGRNIRESIDQAIAAMNSS